MSKRSQRTFLCRDAAIHAKRASGMTLESIAWIFGLRGRERVRQIIMKEQRWRDAGRRIRALDYYEEPSGSSP